VRRDQQRGDERSSDDLQLRVTQSASQNLLRPLRGIRTPPATMHSRSKMHPISSARGPGDRRTGFHESTHGR
jgi:hypothetical protein